MGSSDDAKKTLEQFAREADRVADEHQDHDCATTPLLRAVSAVVRRAAATSSGPAQVATPAYRDHWETLFGKKQPVGQA